MVELARESAAKRRARVILTSEQLREKLGIDSSVEIVNIEYDPRRDLLHIYLMSEDRFRRVDEGNTIPAYDLESLQ